MGGKVKVFNDGGMQETDRVGTYGVSESRVKLLGDCRTTKHGTALQNGNIKTGFGEVSGTNQAVMPATNNDCFFTQLGLPK